MHRVSLDIRTQSYLFLSQWHDMKTSNLKNRFRYCDNMSSKKSFVSHTYSPSQCRNNCALIWKLVFEWGPYCSVGQAWHGPESGKFWMLSGPDLQRWSLPPPACRQTPTASRTQLEFFFPREKTQGEGGRSVNTEHLNYPRLTGVNIFYWCSLTSTSRTFACKNSIKSLLKHGNKQYFLDVIWHVWTSKRRQCKSYTARQSATVRYIRHACSLQKN